MTADIGDIVVLSNNLKLKLILERNPDYFKTIDIDSGKNCTTGICLKDLDDLFIGSFTWGYGCNEYEIVEIIKPKPKPPLRVIPKNIYELQRVQDLCRALYEYSTYEEVGYELMIKWSDELNDRLYGLKGDLG